MCTSARPCSWCPSGRVPKNETVELYMLPVLYRIQIWTMEMRTNKYRTQLNWAEPKHLEAEFMCQPFQPVEAGSPGFLPSLALRNKLINTQLWKSTYSATSIHISAAKYSQSIQISHTQKQHHCGMPCNFRVWWFQQYWPINARLW